MERDLALIFSDWHVHKFKAFSDTEDRLEWSLKVLSDIGEICTMNGIDKVFFAGDAIHTQQVVLTEVNNRLVDAFMTFFERYPKITIYAISGNHDHASKNLLHAPAITYLSMIERISNGKFVLIDNTYADVSDTVRLWGIPYYGQKEDFDAQLDKLVSVIQEDTNADHIKSHQLMIHQTPLGLANKMIPWDTNPEDPRYKVFDRVWCGHIHIQMPLTENFCLVGNPNQNDAADAGRKKGVLLTNLNKPEKGYKFVYLEGYPEFVHVVGDADLPADTGENDYIIRLPDMVAVEKTEKAGVSDFNTNLESHVIMENFWRETTGGKDEDLLKVGLGFLNITSLSPNTDTAEAEGLD